MNATGMDVEVGSLVRLTGTPGHSPMRVRSIVGDRAYCVWPSGWHSEHGHPHADWFCLSGLRLVTSKTEGLDEVEEQVRGIKRANQKDRP